MAEYIDKRAVIDLLHRWASDAEELGEEDMETFASIAYALEDFPVVDAEPVVHGHWHVVKSSCAGMIVTSYQCTVCGKTCATQMRLFHDDAVPTCCCWCGARMDEEESNGGDAD